MRPYPLSLRPSLARRWRPSPSLRRSHLPTALLLAGMVLLAGCSSQAWYESGQVTAELQCQQAPAAAYDDCMARQSGKTYEEYRREREAVRQAP